MYSIRFLANRHEKKGKEQLAAIIGWIIIFNAKLVAIVGKRESVP
jgi:hypothetical protein